MMLHFGLPLLFVLTAARSMGAEPPASPISAAIKAAVKEAYPYDPKIRERVLAAEAAKAEGVIQMEKVVVTDSDTVRRAPQVINEAWQKEMERDFNLLNGGRIASGSLLGRPVEVGLWKYVDPMGSTPSFSGQPSAPKIDLLHLKF